MVAFCLKFADHSDRNDDFMLIEAVDRSWISEQDAGIQDICLATGGTQCQWAPLYSVVLALNTRFNGGISYRAKGKTELGAIYATRSS